MHNLFLVYFVNLYMFRTYLGPSSGGTTVCIQQLILIILFRWLLSWLDWIILFRWLSVFLVGLDSNSARTTDSHLKRIIGTKCCIHTVVDSSWNVMAHGDAREGKWRGNWRMEWVASTLHTSSEHGVSSITTADAQTSAASSRLNWRPRRLKWTRPFRRKKKSAFCVCAITFQLASTSWWWD
jgi:hypothetical protein